MSTRRNYIYNSAYQLLTIALPLATTPYLSRLLGSSGIGEYSYSFAVATYFVLVPMLGVNNYGTRSIAQCKQSIDELRGTFWSIWALQASLSVLSMVGYLMYAVFVAPDMQIALSWVPYVISAALDINWLFFGLERFKFTVARNFLVKLSTFVLMFVVVRGDHPLLKYLLLMSASYVISTLFLWPRALRDVKYLRPSIHAVVGHIRPNLLLFAPVIAISFYTVFSKIMLGHISGMAQAGMFENSVKVSQAPFSLIAALGTVMLPRASSLWSTKKQGELVISTEKSMIFGTTLSFALSFGLIAIAPEFVPIFFGPGFEECIQTISILVFTMPVMAWANVLRTQWLIPAGRDAIYVSSVFAGALVNIVVNLILIPKYGAVGAAFGTLSAEIAVCLVQSIAVTKELPLGRWSIYSIPGLAVGLVMYFIVRISAPLVSGAAGKLVFEVLLGAVVFVSIYCFLLKVFRCHKRV